MLLEGEHDETDITSGDHYEIEKIVAHQRDREGTLFQGRWLGWSQEHDQWFREHELEGAQEVLQQYKDEHPGWDAEAPQSQAKSTREAPTPRQKRTLRRRKN